MSQVKVVELKIDRNKAANLPPIVHTIRQQSKKQLNELLQNLFNSADDALFELADRSQSDAHQEMYFDSMRMVRLHRKTLASTFIRAFYEAFNSAFGSAQSDEPEEEELEAGDYTLLDQDELEMTVAVSGIVSKVTSQYSLAVMQLTKRLDFLSKQQTITERSNPLGPHALSTAFAEALSVLEVDIKIRIILMKLFERFVMERLGPLYDSANRALIDADVLPDLKNKPPRSAAPSTASKSAAQQVSNAATQALASGYLPEASAEAGGIPGAGGGYGGAAGMGGGSAIGFNTVQSLMEGVRDQVGVGGFAGGGGSVLNLPTLPSDELVQVLSQIQSKARSQNIDIEQVPELGDVRTLVLSQVGDDKKALGQADDDTVNFVGMLFDYILNDRNLAIPMKALIGRLQIPIVKLAIIDKSFFEKSSHPARALLNELSSAGIGWSSAQELKRDALYNKIESVVVRVLNEFADNPGVFAELLSELREFVSKDTRRSVLVEQRVKESEAGKAKTHDAKLQVQNLVNQKACGLRLPAEAGKFISEVWTRVLTLRMVKHGPNHPTWRDGVEVLDDLLWVLQPLSELEQIEQRDAKAPGLLSAVSAGMVELGCPEDEVTQFDKWLSAHLENLSENDRAYLSDDERPELAIEETLVEEIVLASPVIEIDEDAIDKSVAEQLKQLTEGSWVEISEEDRKLRCKLATITQPGDKHIFVNRRGMKVLEKSKLELAELLQKEDLKRIDESQVFDRALQSVIGNLRQMQRKRTQ